MTFRHTYLPAPRQRLGSAAVRAGRTGGRYRRRASPPLWRSEPSPWLVAAGTREDGSADDFYAALATDAKASRSAYNAQHSRPLTTQTYVGNLLPDRDDRIVPGCEREGWFPESRFPDRDLLPAEQAWSNLMGPATAEKLLAD